MGVSTGPRGRRGNGRADELSGLRCVASAREDFVRDLGRSPARPAAASLSRIVSTSGERARYRASELSKAIEGVAEMFPPPLLEVRSVSFSEFT